VNQLGTDSPAIPHATLRLAEPHQIIHRRKPRVFVLTIHANTYLVCSHA